MSKPKVKRIAKATTTLYGDIIRYLSNSLDNSVFSYKSKSYKGNLQLGFKEFTLEYISSDVVLITPLKEYRSDGSYGLSCPLSMTFTDERSAIDYLTEHLE